MPLYYFPPTVTPQFGIWISTLRSILIYESWAAEAEILDVVTQPGFCGLSHEISPDSKSLTSTVPWLSTVT